MTEFRDLPRAQAAAVDDRRSLTREYHECLRRIFVRLGQLEAADAASEDGGDTLGIESGAGLVVRLSDADEWEVREIEGTANQIVVADGDGIAANPVIGLATVANGGGGTFLKFTRDSYGRVTGTSAVVTADLTALLSGTYQPLDAQLTSLAGLSYGGNALKVVRVNAGETDFELASVSAGVGDADYGDITVSSSGTVWTVDAGAISYAKIQDVSAASRLLGRGSAGGSGDVEELTLGTGLSLAGTVLSASGAAVADADYGDITVSSSGSVWTIDASAVTYAKFQDASGAGVMGRSLLTAGVYSHLSWATVATELGLGTAAYEDIGTSGATVPLLNGINTWSAVQTFTAANLSTISGSNPALTAATVWSFTRASAAATSAGISVIAGNAGTSAVNFGDTDDEDVGRLLYDHSLEQFNFRINATSGAVIFNATGIGLGGGIVPTTRLQFSGTAAAANRAWGASTDTGQTSFPQTAPGVLLTADGMSAVSKYTPVVGFGSTDSAFTTTNPKLLAGIAGVATEGYAADTDGGMGLVFLGLADNPGTAPSLTVLGEWTVAGGFAPVTAIAAAYGGTGQSSYTTGDILYASAATTLSKLAASTSGYVLTSNGAGVAPSWQAASGGAMTLIGTATVTGSAATVLTLSGLDLSAYNSFFVVFKLDNATGSASTLSLYYNSDTTATNYNRNGLTINGATVTGSRANDGVWGSMPANETTTGQFWIANDRDGRPRANSLENRDATATITTRINSHGWTSATNVTGITISASVASSLAIGSTFTVYGVAA